MEELRCRSNNLAKAEEKFLENKSSSLFLLEMDDDENDEASDNEQMQLLEQVGGTTTSKSARTTTTRKSGAVISSVLANICVMLFAAIVTATVVFPLTGSIMDRATPKTSSAAAPNKPTRPPTTPSPTPIPTEPTTSPSTTPTNFPTTSSAPSTSPSFNPTQSPTISAATISRRRIYNRQIHNFQKRQSLLLNFHIPHHGGNAICGPSQSLATNKCGWPSFQQPSLCSNHIDESTKVHKDYLQAKNSIEKEIPWSHQSTDRNIQVAHRYYNMTTWTFDSPQTIQPPPDANIHVKGYSPLGDTNWEHPNLVSVIIMRHPMERIFARTNKLMKKKYGKQNWNNPNGTPITLKESEWEEFANLPHHTNNLALSILAGRGCCNGKETDRIHLEHAKALLQRFTFVLDMECLDDGVTEMAKILGFGLGSGDGKDDNDDCMIHDEKHKKKKNKNTGSSNHNNKMDPRSRMNSNATYNYLLERNQLDIELYEWSKTISLVNCSHLMLSSEQEEEPSQHR